jgi:hypothetical protein
MAILVNKRLHNIDDDSGIEFMETDEQLNTKRKSDQVSQLFGCYASAAN